MADPFGLDERRMLNDPRSKDFGNLTICLSRDGNMICATVSDFFNLQESPAGFGPTIKQAVSDLLVNRKLYCRKAMWWGYGAPAGTCDEAAYTNEIHPNALAMMLHPQLARCPRHGGFDLDAAAALAIYYRVDQANKIEALDWEATDAK